MEEFSMHLIRFSMSEMFSNSNRDVATTVIQPQSQKLTYSPKYENVKRTNKI